MTVPGHLKPTSASDRKRIKDRIRRDGERERRAMDAPSPPVGRKPSHMLFILVFMILFGVFFVSRIQNTPFRKTIRIPEETAENELLVLRVALEQFRRDCDRYPTTDEGIAVLIANPGETNWNGPYVTMTQNDPWEHPYIYRATSNGVLMISAGPDLVEGSEDDLIPLDWTNHPALSR
jgi:general secretion pathway protein G